MFALMNRGARRRNDRPSLSCFAGRRTGRFLAAASAVALTFGAAGTALAADYGNSELKWVNSPYIAVEADWKKYTTVSAQSHSIEGAISIELDAGASGRVKWWESGPNLGIEGNGTPVYWSHIEEAGKSVTYKPIRPKVVETEYSFSISRQVYGPWMVQACEINADKLRKEGLNDTEIFNQDHLIEVAVSSYVKYEMSGLEGTPLLSEVSPWDSFKKVKVHCLGDPVDLGPVATDITAVTLDANEDTSVHGSCELRLSGSITSKDPNTQVKFLYVDDKGKKSDLKTVNTDAGGVAVFEHDYPVHAHKSGKIQMIGQSPPFMSKWVDYEVKCGGPTNDLITLLPPKAKVLTLAVEEETFYQGRFCPEVVRVIGRVDGRGKASGKVTLGANGAQILDQPFSFEDDETKLFTKKIQISWAGKPPSQQNVGLSMVVHNAVGDTVDAMQKMKSVECRKPQVSDAGRGGADTLAAPETPGPNSVNLSLTELGKKVQNGHVCPERVYMGGSVGPAEGGFSGAAAFIAGGSVKHELDLDLEANHGYSTSYMHHLDWSGAAFPQQTVIYAFKVVNQHGVEVGSKEIIKNFVCQEIVTTGVADAAPGGLSVGKPKPAHAQQAGTGHIVFGTLHGFHVQAPKGRVKSGKIQLSGAKPKAKYALKFYRKKGSSFVPVASAQLPKQMTGSTANFKLAALKGSRAWRLEVCPAGAKNKKACKTTDFRVPLAKGPGGAKNTLGAKVSKGKLKPGPTKVTPVFIMPGLGG